MQTIELAVPHLDATLAHRLAISYLEHVLYMRQQLSEPACRLQSKIALLPKRSQRSLHQLSQFKGALMTLFSTMPLSVLEMVVMIGPSLMTPREAFGLALPALKKIDHEGEDTSQLYHDSIVRRMLRTLLEHWAESDTSSAVARVSNTFIALKIKGSMEVRTLVAGSTLLAALFELRPSLRVRRRRGSPSFVRVVVLDQVVENGRVPNGVEEDFVWLLLKQGIRGVK